MLADCKQEKMTNCLFIAYKTLLTTFQKVKTITENYFSDIIAKYGLRPNAYIIQLAQYSKSRAVRALRCPLKHAKSLFFLHFL